MKLRTFIAVVVTLILIAGVIFVGYINKSSAMVNYGTQLESIYQRSFYELLSNVNNIEVGLSKVLVSSGDKNRLTLYDNVYDECMLANTNLSRLPINHQSIKDTTKFVNKLGGFCYYVSNKLSNGESISSSDYKSTEELYNTSVYIQKIINDFANNMDASYKIIDNVKLDNTETKFDSMFLSMQEGTTDYPTLIYDGPFSESVTNRKIKGLSEKTITKEAAEEKIKDIFKDQAKNIVYDGMTTGKFTTYNFHFDKNGTTAYAQITKNDGQFLTLSEYQKGGEIKFSLKECENIAEKFAKSVGLDDIHSVWSTVLSGTAYVNLTPVVNNVIIYPDMIKAKVSCSTGEILGWEAKSYALNHIKRTDLTPTISRSAAKLRVNPLLNIQTQKLAVIPEKYKSELLAYEFKCTFNSYTYYVYINAKTGEEADVLRVVKTNNGNLLQ